MQLPQHFQPQPSQRGYPHGVMVSQAPPSSQGAAPETSELRAALATPSKLHQQEQLLQQQQRMQQQQQQQLRAPTPHQERQSPNIPSAMQFPFDHRPGVSRTEPVKISPSMDGKPSPAPPLTMSLPYPADLSAKQGIRPSAFSQPDQRMPLPDPRLAHPDHPQLPPHIYQGDIRFHHPGMGYPPGSIGLVPRMGIDPRMMFPPSQHAEFLAHTAAAQGAPPHVIAGMLQQHQQAQQAVFLAQHQGAALDQLVQDRPPSRTTRPPSAQPSPAAPSPRGTPTPNPPSGAPLQHPGQQMVPHMSGPVIAQRTPEGRPMPGLVPGEVVQHNPEAFFTVLQVSQSIFRMVYYP